MKKVFLPVLLMVVMLLMGLGHASAALVSFSNGNYFNECIGSDLSQPGSYDKLTLSGVGLDQIGLAVSNAPPLPLI
jgi:hypothetical protein